MTKTSIRIPESTLNTELFHENILVEKYRKKFISDSIDFYHRKLSNLYVTKEYFENLNEYENRKYILDDGSIYVGPIKVQDCSYVFGVGDFLVSPTGDNANTGGEGDPFASLEYAVSQVSTTGGVTIWVEGGTYSLDSGSGYATVSGNFTNDVIIRSMPNQTVILNHTLGTDAIVFDALSKNIVFEDLTFNALEGDNSVFRSSGAFNVSEIEVRDCVVNLIDSPYVMHLTHGGLGTLQKIKRNNINAGSGNGTCFFQSSSYISYIGNTYVSSSTSSSAIRVDSGLYEFWISNNDFTAPNMTNSVSHQLVQFSSRMLSTGGTINLNRNTGNNISGRVFYTDGAAGSGKVKLIAKGNDFHTTGDRIIQTTITIEEGEVMYNKLHCDNVCLGLPDELSLVSGKEVGGIEISFNDLSSFDHTILFGENGLQNNLHDNIINGISGKFGSVIKGDGHTIKHNVVYGGNRSAVYLKNAENCNVNGNLLIQRVANGNAIEYGTGGVFGSQNNTVTYNLVECTDGFVTDTDTIGTGNVQNNNKYHVSKNGDWGTVITSASSFAEFQSNWSSYASSPDNDNESIES